MYNYNLYNVQEMKMGEIDLLEEYDRAQMRVVLDTGAPSFSVPIGANQKILNQLQDDCNKYMTQCSMQQIRQYDYYVTLTKDFRSTYDEVAQKIFSTIRIKVQDKIM